MPDEEGEQLMGNGSNHYLDADKAQRPEELYGYLCSAAYRGRRAMPESCARCVSPCRYGRKLLELTDTQRTVPDRKEQHELMRCGEAWPTLKMRLRHRRDGR